MAILQDQNFKIMEKLRAINQSAIEAYGSVSHPNYSFVMKVFKRKPYENIVNYLYENFIVNDITEINYDVSFSYIIESNYKYLIQLSMVSKFYILFELDQDKKTRQIITNSDDYKIELLIKKLKQDKFILIDDELTNCSTDLIDLESSNNMTVYQTLFSTG